MNENDKQAEPVQPAGAQAALRKIMEAHRFNVSGMTTTEVHAICFDALTNAFPPLTKPVQPAGAQELRYTADRALAECPCCGSLDVGGVHDTVNCYGCGLTVTAPRPLQNAINKWNQRTNKAPAAEPAPLVRLTDDSLISIYLTCKAEWKATNKRQRQRIAVVFGNAIMDAMERVNK